MCLALIQLEQSLQSDSIFKHCVIIDIVQPQSKRKEKARPLYFLKRKKVTHSEGFSSSISQTISDLCVRPAGKDSSEKFKFHYYRE